MWARVQGRSGTVGDLSCIHGKGSGYMTPPPGPHRCGGGCHLKIGTWNLHLATCLSYFIPSSEIPTLDLQGC